MRISSIRMNDEKMISDHRKQIFEYLNIFFRVISTDCSSRTSIQSTGQTHVHRYSNITMCPITLSTDQNKRRADFFDKIDRKESMTDSKSISTDEKSFQVDEQDRHVEDELHVRQVQLFVSKFLIDDEFELVEISN